MQDIGYMNVLKYLQLNIPSAYSFTVFTYVRNKNYVLNRSRPNL